jgi:hypothetical protein
MSLSSDADKTFFGKLLAAQAEFPKFSNDSTADTGKFTYKYLSLEKLVEKIRPILQKHGLGFIQPLVMSEGKPAVETRLFDETGEGISTVVAIPDNDGRLSGAQAFGSSVSYTRRYSLCSILGIVADDDDDGKKASAPASSNGDPSASGSAPATAKQRAALHAILGDKFEETEQKVGGFTAAKASAIIGEANRRKENGKQN